MEKKKTEKMRCTRGIQGLCFLGFVFFAALAFASLVQGVLLQIYQGFRYGFFAYLIGLLFLGAAKYCKYRLHEVCKS